MSRGMHRSYYSGALQFSVGGRPFYLERNFYHKEPRARLCNLADGEELSVAYGDLGMLLGGVTREAYENTCDIPQCRAVTGAELTGLLAEYLSDMSDRGQCGNPRDACGGKTGAEKEKPAVADQK